MPYSDDGAYRDYMRDYMRRRRAARGQPEVKPEVKPADDEDLTRLRDESAALRDRVASLEADNVRVLAETEAEIRKQVDQALAHTGALTAQEYRLIQSCLHSDTIAFLKPPPELVAKFDAAFIAFRSREGAKQDDAKEDRKWWADIVEKTARRMEQDKEERARKAAATRAARKAAAQPTHAKVSDAEL